MKKSKTLILIFSALIIFIIIYFIPENLTANAISSIQKIPVQKENLISFTLFLAGIIIPFMGILILLSGIIKNFRKKKINYLYRAQA
ncbi:MAG: hypothetical protein PHC28_01395 [Flavobacterium sp.]|uniref:hypothetical protein n=1 Tax=Flavobacterium sp. TaxID=239 RepID=UPI00262B979C|nr:hypothetical protein [Flavobacterium sp.]MDD5149122.1 hypothetical protein [Flavobacterium sp.]